MFRTKISTIAAIAALLTVSIMKPAMATIQQTDTPDVRLSVSAQSSHLIPPAKPAPEAPQAPATPANSENINPVLVQRFTAFSEFIKEKYGVELFIRSGYRDPAEQAKLYNNHPPGVTVAKPGTSNHEKGQAIDYGPYQTSQINQHLGQFGLKLTVPGEAWHIEVVEAH